MKNNVTLEFAAKTENILIARLAGATMAYNCGFDLETIEDIKVAIGEAVTNAIEHGSTSDDTVTMDIDFGNDKLTITVRDHGKGISQSDIPQSFELNERGFGMLLIENLMDETTAEAISEGGTKIVMVKMKVSL